MIRGIFLCKTYGPPRNTTLNTEAAKVSFAVFCYPHKERRTSPMKSIRKNALILLSGTAAALILEALPFGAVLNFATPDGETIRKTFSYFSPIAYGYANFAPLLTALFTCWPIIFCVVALISQKKNHLRLISRTSLLPVITSILPLISYFSVTALFISLILILVFILSIIFQKQSK